MARRTWLMLGLCAGVAVARPARALEPHHHLDDYLHDAWPRVAEAATVRAVLPARAGHLWVGTSEGLVRFDGPRITVFDARRLPAIAEGNVFELLEASDGALWVGSRERGLSRLRGEQVTSWRTRDGLSDDRVRALAETRDGTIWVATAQTVVRFDPGATRPQRVLEGLPGPVRNIALVIDAAGVLWLGTHSGMFRWDPAAKRWQADAGPPGVPPPLRVEKFWADPDGTLWIGTYGAGLWERRSPPGGRPDDATWRLYTEQHGLGSLTVTAIRRDGEGNLWVGTRAGNLTWKQGDRFQPLPLGPGMCGDAVEALAEDSEGGLWIATNGCGLHRLKDRAIRRLSKRDGLPMAQLVGVAGSPDGPVWTTSRGGGVARIDPATGRAEPLACPGPEDCARCWDLAVSTGGTFWSRCPGRVVKWDGKAMNRVALPEGLTEVDMLTEGSDGALWLAHGRTVVRWQGATSARIAVQEVLTGARVIHQGRSGVVWIAADDGVAEWRNGNVRLHRPRPLPDPTEISNLHEDAAGALWIATKGAGLRRLSEGRMATINTTHGLPTNWIVQVLDDDRGRLWMSTSRGLVSADKRELDEVMDGRRPRIDVGLYDDADGVVMRTNTFAHPAGFKDATGRMWFATMNGVAIVDPSALRGRRAPRVVIESARVGDRALPLAIDDAAAVARAPVLGAAPRDLEVQFAALSFAPAATLSFRYRLDGRDSDWIEAAGGRIARYPELPAGRYQLRIEARHRDGDWGRADVQVRFELRPPFHRTPWFVLMLAGSAAMVLLLAHRVRLARARAALQALMSERGRIARDIHDTLAQAFVATSMQLECVDHALEAADATTARKHLDTARRVVRQSLEEARRSVWVLRPQALERGLPAALDTLVGGSSGEAIVSLEVAGTPRPLTPSVEANLLRIAQEGVSNAYRHARARRITMRLAFEPRSVVLSVIDDGSGIESASGGGDGRRGMEQGLEGMKERAAEIGGKLSITGAPGGGGTEIRVEVPTAREARK